MRREGNPCASHVIFADLNRSVELPVGEFADILLTIEKPGEYSFTCQMGMYRGTLIIEG